MKNTSINSRVTDKQKDYVRNMGDKDLSSNLRDLLDLIIELNIRVNNDGFYDLDLEMSFLKHDIKQLKNKIDCNLKNIQCLNDKIKNYENSNKKLSKIIKDKEKEFVGLKTRNDNINNELESIYAMIIDLINDNDLSYVTDNIPIVIYDNSNYCSVNKIILYIKTKLENDKSLKLNKNDYISIINCLDGCYKL